MVDTGIPGRSEGGAFRRSLGGVLRKRLPQEYDQHFNTYLRVKFSTPDDPTNYVYRTNNADPNIYHYPIYLTTIDPNVFKWGFGKLIKGDYSTLDQTWKLMFYASGGLNPGERTLQDPLPSPTISWNATDERVEVDWDTGWVDFKVSDLQIFCLGNWFMPWLEVRNQDEERLLRFQYNRPGGMFYTCDGGAIYSHRIRLQLSVENV